jgi:hypothetical protein
MYRLYLLFCASRLNLFEPKAGVASQKHTPTLSISPSQWYNTPRETIPKTES